MCRSHSMVAQRGAIAQARFAVSISVIVYTSQHNDSDWTTASTVLIQFKLNQQVHSCRINHPVNDVVLATLLSSRLSHSSIRRGPGGRTQKKKRAPGSKTLANATDSADDEYVPSHTSQTPSAQPHHTFWTHPPPQSPLATLAAARPRLSLQPDSSGCFGHTEIWLADDPQMICCSSVEDPLLVCRQSTSSSADDQLFHILHGYLEGRGNGPVIYHGSSLVVVRNEHQHNIKEKWRRSWQADSHRPPPTGVPELGALTREGRNRKMQPCSTGSTEEGAHISALSRGDDGWSEERKKAAPTTGEWGVSGYTTEECEEMDTATCCPPCIDLACVTRGTQLEVLDTIVGIEDSNKGDRDMPPVSQSCVDLAHVGDITPHTHIAWWASSLLPSPPARYPRGAVRAPRVESACSSQVQRGGGGGWGQSTEQQMGGGVVEMEAWEKGSVGVEHDAGDDCGDWRRERHDNFSMIGIG
ncbi:hypothetical protein B0H10DRAFT_1953597 [Mycena sp. CBHHK59/15]|nr:hypothetical protein B0H10DRAFT_1953597 [Mycena sp. CBHHK59/15]